MTAKVMVQLEFLQKNLRPKSCFSKGPFLWDLVTNVAWKRGLLWQ